MLVWLFIINIIFLLGILGIYRYLVVNQNIKHTNKYFIVEIIIIGVSVYLYLFISILSPFGDTTDFVEMAQRLMEGDFYGMLQEHRIVYPPLFQYFFYVLAKIMFFFGIPYDWNSRFFVFAVKLPCIICVFIMAYLTYQIAKKYVPEEKRVMVLYLLLLNPGYIFVTAYVCQVDALYTVLMFLTLYLIVERKLQLSYFAFGAAFLMKFQSVFIAPVLIFAIIDQVILHDFSWKRFWKHLLTGLTAILCMVLSYIPFIYNFQTGEFTQGGITQNFASSIQSFGKGSQNAYNFWTLVGYNQVPITESFGPFSCGTWGNIFIVLLVGLSVIFFIKKGRDISIYPMIAALLVSGMYCFAVKMMSRYLYPAIIFLILGYVMKPTKQRLLCAILFIIAFFFGTTVEYLVYPWYAYTRELILPNVISIFSIICFGYLCWVMAREKLEYI